MSSRALARVLIVGLLGAAAGCAGPDTSQVVPHVDEAVAVGAFDFPESDLLAELYAQALERAGVPVQRLGRIGPREVVEPALAQGLVDVVPEYLGAAMQFAAAGRADSVEGDEATVQALDEALGPSGVSALPAAHAVNTNAFVVHRRLAEELGLAAVSDLARLEGLVLGGPAECPQRRTCLPGLAEVYGVRPAAFLPLADAGDVVVALETGEVDVGLLFSTDAQLSLTAHLVLDDDLGLQPAEHVVPVVRDAALARWPVIRPTLTAVGHELTTSSLRELNRTVQIDGVPTAEAVRAWLDRRSTPLRGATP